MSGFSDYLETQLLNHVFRATPYTSPATVYVALYTVSPGETGGGTEVSGGSYVRQAVTFGAPSGGVVANNADVNFPTASSGWGTAVAFGIFDAASAGNLLAFNTLTASKTINSGDSVKLSTGALTVALD